MPLSIKVNLRVTGHCNQGGRKYMEDMFSVAYQQTSDDKDLEYAFFGIFDGHGGGEAATFAKEHLMDIIVKQRNFWSDKDEDVLRAIRDGYVNTHYAMWRELEKWPRTASGLPSTAGTTASVAFIRKGKIYIGHVGDSGIILGYQDEGDPQWKAKPLTKDHKPESVPEMIRIQESGGKVVSKSGVPRVVWNRPRIGHKGPVRRSTHIDEIPFLAVARSLGDLWSYNSELDTFVVSPEPDVKVVTVDVKSHRCLIFGTDGLWNVLTPQAAVAIVQAAERHNEKHLIASQQTGNGPTDIHMWINPSKSLVDRALDRWCAARLRADNTSVVTLMLDPPGPSRSEVLISRKNEQVPSPKSFVLTPSVSSPSPPEPMETIPNPTMIPTTTILPIVDDKISPPINPSDSEKTFDESPKINDSKSTVESLNDEVRSVEKEENVETKIAESTSRESIQVPEISSSDAFDETSESPNHDKIIESPTKDDTSMTKKNSTENDVTNVDSSHESSSPSTSSDSVVNEIPSSPNSSSANVTIKDDKTSLIRQNCFYGSCDEFKNRPRLRRTCGNVYPEILQSSIERNAKIQQDSTSKTEVKLPQRRRQSQGNALTSHLESRQVRRRKSANPTTSNCLSERKKSYHSVAGGTMKNREILYTGINRDRRNVETTMKLRNNNDDSIVNDATTTIGSKRRHSSTSEPIDDGNFTIQEPIAKRRTRSEDRPLPTDENDPDNQEKQRQQQLSRLRWPEEQSTSRLRSETNNSRLRNNANAVASLITEKLPSPTSFQRRSLEKKATPVKTIRRPSINGSNRVQLRGSFALRDWDQSKSGHREHGRLNRTVGSVIATTENSSTTPNLQRWLRSDTLAATPVKTLRSRNVDITGHTVPAQLAHQYGVAKQNRLSLPAKLKVNGKIVKSSSTTSTGVSGNLGTGKLQKSGNLNNPSNTSNTVTPGSGSGITKRVKSPYNPTARSALGTRSRLKRLGK